MKGIVFDIQHYCIHDGPGIRANIFLKGCPLRCLWCQNPESQKMKPELMYNVEKCTGCGKCVEKCPQGAISMVMEDAGCTADGTAHPVSITDRSKCTACGACVHPCFAEARSIAGEEMTVEEAFAKVEQDKIFFGTDGGVTVTGGEPLVQWEFTRDVMKMCHENGINTCIETCLYGDWDKVKAVFEHVDLGLCDVKHMDSEQHKYCTGVGNEQILDNLKRISQEMGVPVIVRTPIIPGYNDTVENMEAMGQFIRDEVPTCQQVELLPFHNMGESKKVQLQEDTSGFSSHPPTDEEMQKLRDAVGKYVEIVK